MKYRQQMLLLYLALACLPQGVVANERYAVAGVGAISCGEWAQGRAKNSTLLEFQMSAWLQGFLSGMNVQQTILAGKEMALLPDSQTLLIYVDKYCRDNPLNVPWQGLWQLYREISKP